MTPQAEGFGNTAGDGPSDRLASGISGWGVRPLYLLGVGAEQRGESGASFGRCVASFSDTSEGRRQLGAALSNAVMHEMDVGFYGEIES